MLLRVRVSGGVRYGGDGRGGGREGCGMRKRGGGKKGEGWRWG